MRQMPCAARLLAMLCFIPAGAAGQGAHPRQDRTAEPQRTGRVAEHRLVATEDGFRLDDRPFQIISGEMHYPRIPRAYWRDRLRKARAMGLNTISTYVFWNLHEPEPGVYDFRGQHDVAAFVRLAQTEGLYVILRPGPYVCAEWELGGYPAWLLADPLVTLRSLDPRFTGPAGRWLDRLGRELAPLLSTRGGPIIAVQVENEYGSFDHDTAYLRWQVDALRHAGLGDVLLYTADGPDRLAAGTLPDLPAAVNFGPGHAERAFAALEAFRPRGARLSGEYWAGWFDSWGKPHHRTDAEREAHELDWMLSHGYSVNLYMFHGGTSFGLMSGANGTPGGGDYAPQTTSYDYDAALDEGGRPTPKYFVFREVIARHRPGVTLPDLPPSPPTIEIPRFALDEAAPLWSVLGTPVRSEEPRSMEALGQSYGYVLYRTHLVGPQEAELVIDPVRDYVRAYVNGTLAGTLDRRLGEDRLPLRIPPGPATLDLLVENLGRINFTKALRTEQKGIVAPVRLGGERLAGWEIFPLPPARLIPSHFGGDPGSGPAVYRGTFSLRRTGDTFLDLRGWGKGIVWVNGHLLGRFWSIGPQRTLYVPGPWLRRGTNTVVVFDLDIPSRRSLAGLREPVLDQLEAPPERPTGGA
jgi:beta-galactosidase